MSDDNILNPSFSWIKNIHAHTESDGGQVTRKRADYIQLLKNLPQVLNKCTV